MSTLAGLLFLLGGVGLFAAAVLVVAVRDRSTRSPRRSLERFRRSTHSLHKIHFKQATLTVSARARARAMHPASRPSAAPQGRRPA